VRSPRGATCCSRADFTRTTSARPSPRSSRSAWTRRPAWNPRPGSRIPKRCGATSRPCGSAKPRRRAMATRTEAPSLPDASGHFGPYGGRFVPETLVLALAELTEAYEKAQADPAFRAELEATLRDFAGRPTPLFEAKRFSEKCGCRVLLKREDLL